MDRGTLLILLTLVPLVVADDSDQIEVCKWRYAFIVSSIISRWISCSLLPTSAVMCTKWRTSVPLPNPITARAV